MDAQELMDDMEQFETDSVLAEMATDICLTFSSVPSDPRTSQSIVWETGMQQFVIGAEIRVGV